MDLHIILLHLSAIKKNIRANEEEYIKILEAFETENRIIAKHIYC